MRHCPRCGASTDAPPVACAACGYAVYVKDKIYKFDEAGNTSAAEILKNTKSKKGLHVKVEGTIDGEMIKVTKITEVKS